MTDRTSRILAVIGGAALALSWTNGAHALSFALGPTDEIVDIDFSSASQSLTYDGTNEMLSLTAEADVLRLAGGSDIVLSPGQVVLSLSVSLVPGSLTIGSDVSGNGNIGGTFRNGSVADFTLVDTGADGDASDDLLLAADFTPSGLTLSADAFFGLVTGSLGGEYVVLPSSTPAFADAILGRGTMAVTFSQVERAGLTLTAVCDLADDPCAPPIAPGTSWPGLKDFNAQPGLDLTPVPEPATFVAVALGLGTLLAASRFRQRRA